MGNAPRKNVCMGFYFLRLLPQIFGSKTTDTELIKDLKHIVRHLEPHSEG